MSHKQFIATTVAAVLGLTVYTSFAHAEPTLKSIKDVRYNPASGQLVIESTDHSALTTQDVTHNPRRREIVLYIPETTIQPTPRMLQIEKDPIVKSIRLDQRARDGIPAVRLEVDLYTNSPFLPFSLVSDDPGLKISLSPRQVENQVAEETSDSEDKVQLRVHSQSPAVNMQAIQTDNPKTTLSFKASDPDLNQKKQQVQTIDTILGPQAEDTMSVIEDIFYDNGSLIVVSQNQPITVKRSFLLAEPDRYVVDLSPAVLASTSLTRAIPQNNPKIHNFKTGQFDENTVRIVAQFSRKPTPVDISQWENNKVLKINFN